MNGVKEYRLGDKSFSCFDDVVVWVWNEYKIMWEGDDDPSEFDKEQALAELETIIGEL